MNLGDVLRGVGDGPLKDHKWTDAIVSTLNATCPSAKALTADSTGREALESLVLLPEADRDQLLASEVDLLKGTLTLVDGPAKEATDAKSEKFHRMILNDLVEHPKSTLALFAGIIITLAVVFLVITMTLDYTRTGKGPDTGLLTTLFHILADLFGQMDQPPGQ